MNQLHVPHQISPNRTKHAQRRLQQRGIRNCDLDFVYLHADRVIPCGGNAHRLFLSKRATQALISDERLSPQQASRCQRIVIVAAADQHIITAYRKPQTHH